MQETISENKKINEIYYDRDGIIVRRSTRQDVEYIKNRLNKHDIKEIWASHNIRPEQALMEGIDKSIVCLTVQNGNPICMFGINADNVLGKKATIWMLSTPDLFKIRKRFLRHSRKFIDMFLDWYPYLENYVHIDNRKSIEWLRWLNATIEEAKPFGADGELFYYFYFKKGEQK